MHCQHLGRMEGEKVKPKYSGLEGKRVPSSVAAEKGLSNDATSMLLTRYLEERLGQNVKDIKIIPQEKIDKWLNEIGRDEPTTKRSARE